MKEHNLSEQELAICRQMGVSPEDYQATKRTEQQTAICQESGQALEGEKKKIMQMMGISPAEAEKIEAEHKRKIAASAPLTKEEVEVCRLLNVEPSEYWATRCDEAGGESPS
jgi:hypothetical protein